jgi:regulation of enolase protein 1 (concanavalin A-like superfamily)
MIFFKKIDATTLYKLISWICFIIACLFSIPALAQYSSVYNGVTYTSSQPYNLNVVYFVPNDVPPDTSYKRRVSEYMIYGQNFFKQNMIANGYGAKTFGLFKEASNPNRIKLIRINGAYPGSAYPYTNPNQLTAEVNAYFNANPSQKTSDHILIIAAVPDINNLGAGVPFYGLGRNCFALDYKKMDIQYMNASGADGNTFRSWYGSLLHELGHGINLPHSHQTSTENSNPAQGMNLMFYGNGTLGVSPTFINRAGCAVLNTCQVFATSPGNTYYNGHSARVTSLHAAYDNGDLVVSGKFTSNVPVTDINIFQDPYSTPSAGYYRVAWSVSPIGTDSFYVRMKVSDVNGMADINPNIYNLQNTIAYNLQIDLVLKNGETGVSYFPYAYSNNVPGIHVDFDDLHCDTLCCGWAETNVGTRPWGPVPGYVCYKAANNNNMKVKTFSTLWGTNDAFPFGYTTLTGDGSIVARVKNVSANYNDYGGIMMRNSLNANDKYVSTGVLDTRGMYDQNRYAAGAPTGANGLSGGGLAAATTPVWVKLQRKGNTISSFYSQNGTIWTPYNNYNTTMGNTLYAGVFASNPGAVADIDFPAVRPCTLPSGWQAADIGTTSAPGTACNNNPTAGNVHMESYGSGFVTGPADNVTFMYKAVTGNVNIVARIKNVSNGWNTMGGLMLRNTLTANSAFVATGALDTRSVFNTHRESQGANSGYNGLSPNWAWPAPMWVQISRAGNAVTTYYSIDGSNWFPFHSYSLALNSTIYVGLVSAGMGQASEFDQVWINGVLQSQNEVALSENNNETELQIVPNPSRGEIRILGIGNLEIKSTRVMDMQGHVVFQQTTTSDVLNIGELSAAIYIVEVQLSNGEIIRQRVSKL